MAKVPPPSQSKSRKGAPPPLQHTQGNLDKPEPTERIPLNFKVLPEFYVEFKTYAVRHRVSMAYLLQQGFNLIKSQQE